MENANMVMTQRAKTPQSIWRWYLVPCFQKSTRIRRKPLNAWKTMAATRAVSPSAISGFL